MKIAILAWGSLVWDRRTLTVSGEACEGGPKLPIEFLRVSSDGRLTLVIDEKNGAVVPTRYYVSACTELSQAIANLQEREGMPKTENVGYVDVISGASSPVASAAHPAAVAAIREWATKNGFDAAVWTALPSNFEKKTQVAFSCDAAAQYVLTLPADKKAVAIEYVTKAPREVDTPVRRLLTAHVASPTSTGGAGTVLEHRFAASCTALMLCRGEMPFFPSSTITKVSVQSRSLNWRLDDALIEGLLPGSRPFKVAVQAKRVCAPLPSDGEFVDFIQNAWADFIATDRFTKESDRLLLVSTFQSSKLYRFRQLIEQAQATTNAAEWGRKLGIPNFLSAEVCEVRDTIVQILKKGYAKDLSDDELWDFARHCGVMFTDLDAEGSLHEVQILSLLRTTCSGGDPAAGAAATWDALNRITAFEEGKAKTFQLQELPQELKSRHALARAVDAKLIDDLRRDTETVLARSRDTVQGAAIERVELVTKISTALNAGRVVLITGGAGSGKSAVAKRVFRETAQDAFSVAYYAEEFAAANLRSAPAMHGVDLSKFDEVSGLFPKRVVLVESVERLLEDNRRDAFLDFLREMRRDPTWHVLLTCRSSASATVELAFLAQAELKAAVIEVPPLSDPELAEIAAKLPQLNRPLSAPQLKELLRQPFLLEKAASLQWPVSEALPTAERQFREKVWNEIVRKNSATASGLPQRRSDAFISLALKRAKELVPFVSASSFDADAIQRLRDDDLVATSKRSDALIAPAHDMLEDWALLQWLDETFYVKEDRLIALLEYLELFPALRRAYRKWLGEWIEAEPDSAGPQIIRVIRAASLPQQWRDETIAGIMRSSHAASFVKTNSAALVENKGELLFRCVHLCRVAATARASHASVSLGRLSIGRVPTGAGWVALADLVRANLGLVDSEERTTLISRFVADWSRTVTAKVPYPDGAAVFAEIALALIDSFESYRTSENEKALVEAVLKIPLAAKDELIRQIRVALKESRFERHGGGLCEFTLDHFHGANMARDLPDIVIECVTAYLYDKNSTRDRWRGSSQEVGWVFGLREFLELDTASASARKGPFFHLLCHHPGKGVNLVITIINRAASDYATNALSAEYIEPPNTIEIELGDGAKKKIISNSRLWMMYRGGSVAPYVLQSALMALEEWLLLFAEANPDVLPTLLKKIVTDTNNVALLAVVASVATAFPKESGEMALVVISHPALFHLDLERMTHEGMALEDMFGGVSLDAAQRLEKEERRHSRKRPHRRKSVEDLCRDLQFTPLRDRVWAILDRFRDEAGGDKPKDDDAAVWLNIVHRMDVRTFEVVKVEGDRAYVAPKPLPKEVNDRLEPHRPALETNQIAMTLLNWGMGAFSRKLRPDDAAKWRQMFHLARTTTFPKEDLSFGSAGATHVAVVVVRDHWAELQQEEREWCIGDIGAAVMKDAETESSFVAMQNHETNGDRPAAFIVARLLASLPDDEAIQELAAVALTHPVEQVRLYAAAGFEQEFKEKKPDLFRHVLHCFASGFVSYGALHAVEDQKPWDQQREGIVLLQEALSQTQSLIQSKQPLSDDLLKSVRFDAIGSDLFTATIARWLTKIPDTPAAREFFARNAERLIALWGDKSDRQGKHSEATQAFEKTLARYLLCCPSADAQSIAEGIAAAVATEPDDVGMFFWDLVIEADTLPGVAERFWNLWEIFAKTVTSLPVEKLRHRRERIIRKLFLDLEGSSDEEEWPLIKGREKELVGFYSALPPTALATTFFLRYLRRYGKSALPAAFVALARKLSEDASDDHLNDNNVFLLEQVLSARIFATPLELKKSPEIRNAVLTILDALVNAGSAAAYIMRDDFATPISAILPTAPE